MDVDAPTPSASPVTRLLPRIIQRRRPVAPSVVRLPPTTTSVDGPTLTNQLTDVAMEGALSALERMTIDSAAVKEKERLAVLLFALETCLSDWSLSTHKSTGLLDKLKAANDGYIHLQHLLPLQTIRALTSTQADLQKALRSRVSSTLSVSESGFHIRRIKPPNVLRLEALKAEDWQSMSIYLDNVSLNLGTTPHALAQSLSSVFNTPIQTVVLPQIPLAAPFPRPSGSGEVVEDENAQAEVFRLRSRKSERAGRPHALPLGGGSFKSFCFVILESLEEAERILSEWSWESGGKGDKEVSMLVDDTSDKNAFELKAREGNLRALSYTRWKQLKEEYLAYQATLTLRPESSSAHFPTSSSPASPLPERQLPPHLSRHSSALPKRAHDQVYSNGAASASVKKLKSELGSNGGWEKRIRSLSPTEDERMTMEMAGEYDEDETFPRGCILWIRNVHEKSTKSTLKSLFMELLSTLSSTPSSEIVAEDAEEEGKVEFVDYTKGATVVYLRLSTASAARLMYSYFESFDRYHLSPTYLSDTAKDERSSVKVDVMEGEREMMYWNRLPESAKKMSVASGHGVEEVDEEVAEIQSKRRRNRK